jgi:hypothetical protein
LAGTSDVKHKERRPLFFLKEELMDCLFLMVALALLMYHLIESVPITLTPTVRIVAAFSIGMTFMFSPYNVKTTTQIATLAPREFVTVDDSYVLNTTDSLIYGQVLTTKFTPVAGGIFLIPSPKTVFQITDSIPTENMLDNYIKYPNKDVYTSFLILSMVLAGYLIVAYIFKLVANSGKDSGD